MLMCSLSPATMMSMMIMMIGVAVFAEPNALKEYCDVDTFNGKCPEGELVVMQEARYGRMRVGTCIDNNYGHMGCSSDILQQFDQWCSGRPSCDVAVRDLVVDGGKPCSKDLRSYLEARYTCVKVFWPNVHRCHSSSPLVLDGTSGYAGSYVTKETGCGGIDSPWLIRASPGQRINLTLYDFGSLTRDSGLLGTHTCQVLAVIKEEGKESRETICSGRHRVGNMYMSTSSEVEVRFVVNSNKDKNRRYFMVKYEVSGCAHLADSASIWFKSTTGGAEVGCRGSSDAWPLTCVGNQWVGAQPACAAGEPLTDNVSMSSTISLPNGLSILIIIAIALVIGAVVLTIGIVCIKRRRTRHRGALPADPALKDCPKLHSEYYTQSSSHSRDSGPYTEVHPSGIPNDGMYTPSSGENNYYRTWEMQRHPPVPNGTGTLPGHGSLPLFARGRDDSPPRYTEHIYESPKSVRREYAQIGGGSDSLKCFELDPKGMEKTTNNNADNL